MNSTHDSGDATAPDNLIRLSPRRAVPSDLLARARRAQPAWARQPLAARLEVVSKLRAALAEHALDVAAATDQRPVVETLSGEILPVLEACRYLERHAARILQPELRTSRVGIWLRGVRLRIERDPFGVVLVIGASNYGLMLAGIQALQALVAGNAVIVKPAAGTSAVLRELAGLLEQSGLPAGLLSIADESVTAVHRLLDGMVDKVVFTGSSTAGRAVIGRAAELLIPTTAELSGWDAALILDDADLDRAAAAIAFSLTFNAGRTCLAARRLLVTRARHEAFVGKLLAALEQSAAVEHDWAVAARLRLHIADALSRGARLAAGKLDGESATGPLLVTGVTAGMPIFATEIFGSIALVTMVDDEADAVAKANEIPYGLGASIFGSRDRAARVARGLNAGVVTINDTILPAAHPALPIAPRGASGIGVTRGPEGLLAMTRPKAIAFSPSRRPAHLSGRQVSAETIAAYIRAAYGRGAWRRTRAALRGLLTLTNPREHKP